MSNRRIRPDGPPLPPALGGGWTTLDYALAAAFAWSLAATSPVLMALPLLVLGWMSPPSASAPARARIG